MWLLIELDINIIPIFIHPIIHLFLLSVQLADKGGETPVQKVWAIPSVTWTNPSYRTKCPSAEPTIFSSLQANSPARAQIYHYNIFCTSTYPITKTLKSLRDLLHPKQESNP